jgi:glycosyltransferase involved in cell wall biosynthesis
MPVRINFILPTVNLSGGIRVAAIHARALAERGHEVVLVSPPPALTLRERLGRLARPREDRPSPSHLDGLGLDHRVLERWRPVADRDVPDGDAVVATWWETAEWVAALDRSKGAKAYFIQHHEVFPYLPVDRVKATYRLPLHKLVIAHWLKDLMAREYGDGDADLVPNAVDHRQFFAPPRGRQAVPTVGFLWHETPFKGLDVALAVLARLKEKFPDLKAVAFGSEPPSGGFPLADWVEFHFSPPQDALRDLYASCDLWLTASRSEGFNLPAMEAMACRTPVAATRTGWPEEGIVPGRNGFLAEVDDVEGLVRGAARILGLPDPAWRELSRAAWETVADYSWERSSDLFEAALGRARKRTCRGEIAGIGGA